MTVIGLDNLSTDTEKIYAGGLTKTLWEISGTSHTGSLEVIEGDICDLPTCRMQRQLRSAPGSGSIPDR